VDVNNNYLPVPTRTTLGNTFSAATQSSGNEGGFFRVGVRVGGLVG
jgi:hypothetical protein